MLFGKKKTIEELKKKLGKTEAELKASQDLLKDSNDQINDARRRSAAIKSDLTDSIEAKEKAIAELEKKLGDTEAKLKEAVGGKAKALEELTSSKSAAESLEKRLGDAETKLKDALSGKEKALADATSAKGEIESLEKKLGDTEAKLKDAVSRKARALEDLASAKGDIESLERKLDDTESRLKRAADGRAKALEDLASAKGVIGTLKTAAETAAGENAILASALASKEREIEDLMKETDDGYDVVFVADGELVSRIRMDSEDDACKIPEVPFKEHYNGEWQYERDGKSVTVTAVYTPIVYDLVFFVDDARYMEKKATADEFSDLPPVPEREDYTGEWRYTVIDGCSARIDAVYTPIVYDLVFFVDDVKYAEMEASAEDFGNIPAVPEKEDYSGEWRYTVIDGDCARVDAVYTPIVYDLVFFVDDVKYAEMEASAEDFGSIPPVPEKEDYTGEWAYTVIDGDCARVDAVYTPIVYDLVFFVDDEKYAEMEASAEDFGNIPAVPEREDYAGEWRYTVIDGDCARVDAVYTPIEYKIRYIVDGEEIASTVASAESDVIIPKVPAKEGYKGEWQYEADGDVVNVEAVYSPEFYDLVFFVDDEKFAEMRVDPDTDFDLPSVPEKEDCAGEWAYTVIDGCSARIDAVYTPITYLLRFFVDGEMVAERAASPGSDVDIPAVPAKEGYKGEWQYEDVGDNVAVVEAVYTPAYYDLVFFVDDAKYDEMRVDPDADFDLPAVPSRKGYEGEWAYTAIDGCSARIDAVYRPLERFKLTFYVDGKKYAECEVAGEDDLDGIPKVPAKEDFDGEWQYVQTGEDSADMFAVYTPKEYRLSFFVDGEKYAEAIVGSEDDKDVVPAVPKKKGFVGEWMYEGGDDGNVTVTAIYTPE
jgi:predicted  nucleic acid-binding Zn-ribbon protein